MRTSDRFGGLLFLLALAGLCRSQPATPPPSPAPQRKLHDEGKSEPRQDASGVWETSFAFLSSFAWGAPKPVSERIARNDGPRYLRGLDDELQPENQPEKDAEAIPANVKALDGRKVRVEGFMMPLKMEKGGVRQFLLMRNQMMCCYGIAPQANEWIVVDVVGDPIAARMDEPIYVTGLFRVGVIREDGAFIGIYRLETAKTEG